MYKNFIFLLLSLLILCGFNGKHSSLDKVLKLDMRSEVKTKNGNWKTVNHVEYWKTSETAIIICDMWNQHWCKGATKRLKAMAPRMNKVISAARKIGVLIVHAPSSTMKYYKDYPERKAAENAPYVKPPVPVPDWCNINPLQEGPLPIDASDGGCTDNPPSKEGSPWTHETSLLKIKEGDIISDNGQEIYNVFHQKGIKNVILMGVHLNMCVIGRPFGIREELMEGKNVVFTRDLTDLMYDSKMPPYVSHEQGLKLMIKHIEKYLCPSILGKDLTKGYTGIASTKHAARPVISPHGGNHYGNSLKVTLHSDTKGAKIYYTTDNSKPTIHSNLYTSPIILHHSAIIRAIATKKGYKPSSYIPVANITLFDTVNHGLNYTYYQGVWKHLPYFSKLKPLAKGVSYDLNPLEIKKRDNHYGIVFTGYIKIPKNGTYTFYDASDDGTRLFIDNKMIVNNDGSHGSLVKKGKIKLKKGLTPIKILYFQDTEGVQLQLSYKIGDGNRMPVDGGMLYRNKN